MQTIHEVNDLIKESQSFLSSSKLNSLKKTKADLESQLNSPDFWQDNLLSSKVNRELTTINKKIEILENLQEKTENLKAALDLAVEEEIIDSYKSLQKILEQLEEDKYFGGKYDHKDCLLAIHAGAGGLDAQDWAAMLSSMYQAFAKSLELQTSIVSLSIGEEGGVKSAMLEIKGEKAYGIFKEEHGVHRLVRLSPFNSGNTRETSFALVETLPSGLHEDSEQIEIEEKDLKWDYFMSSGAGGQSVNTTYSAVRVTHLPTKITVSCQNERSQIQNKTMAMKYLKDKLTVLQLQNQEKELNELKGEKISAEWGSQIRNYVLHPYRLVKDLRSGYETTDTDRILLHGQLWDLILSVKQAKLNQSV